MNLPQLFLDIVMNLWNLKISPVQVYSVQCTQLHDYTAISIEATYWYLSIWKENFFPFISLLKWNVPRRRSFCLYLFSILFKYRIKHFIVHSVNLYLLMKKGEKKTIFEAIKTKWLNHPIVSFCTKAKEQRIIHNNCLSFKV